MSNNINVNRPMPNLDAYDFEGQLEQAVIDSATAHDLFKGTKQQSDEKLRTPRFECMFITGEQQQRSYIVPNTNPPLTYPNRWDGVLYVKIVTNRKNENDNKWENHRRLRAFIRWIMQDHINELTARMKYLDIIQVKETATRPSFVQEQTIDVSSIAFAVKFDILPIAFPTSGQYGLVLSGSSSNLQWSWSGPNPAAWFIYESQDSMPFNLQRTVAGTLRTESAMDTYSTYYIVGVDGGSNPITPQSNIFFLPLS